MVRSLPAPSANERFVVAVRYAGRASSVLRTTTGKHITASVSAPDNMLYFGPKNTTNIAYPNNPYKILRNARQAFGGKADDIEHPPPPAYSFR